MNQSLEKVAWLSHLTESERDEVQRHGREMTFVSGQNLVTELESGDDLFVISSGEAVVTVAEGQKQKLSIAKLGPGDVCGEISVLTKELRSATVTAQTSVTALCLSRDQFFTLCQRHPHIAIHFVGVLAERLENSRAAIAHIAADPASPGQTPAIELNLSVFRRAWNELVVSHGHELPFLALTSFLATIIVVRTVFAGARLDDEQLFVVLRSAYTTGFLLILGSTAVSLLRFRRGWQRLVAIIYGIGFGLVLNELSVFLAFDSFYLTMTERDPALSFSVRTLYARSESLWATSIMAFILVQLTYLGRFYRRLGFLLSLRLKRS